MARTVDVIISAGAIMPAAVFHRSAAVIDVFRATSVIVEAIRNGAQRVVPVVTVEEACALKAKFEPGHVLLGGERDTVLIPGFDKDNSPLAYDRASVEGATVIFTTTNGTRAILGARGAHEIYIASFLNMGAVCRQLAATGRDAVLVCAGREDHFTAEDGLCAGAMTDILVRAHGFEATDLAEAMQRMYMEAAGDLPGRLATTQHYQHILQRGYGADIDFCLQRDIYDTVPYYDPKGEIRALGT